MSSKPNQVELSQLFGTVAAALAANRESLNQADPANHNHGDNMVEAFDLIAKTIRSQRTASPAEQLMEASRALGQRPNGSAQVYARGLERASNQFQGQKFLTPENILLLIQLVMGLTQKAGQPPATPSPQAAIGDLIGALLGAGRAAPQAQQPSERAGAPSSSPAAGGIDLGDLVGAGMAYMRAKQQGADEMTALSRALGAGSAMSGSEHRTQSGALVVNTLLQALAATSAKK
jgi:hypothetical protein